MILNGEKLVNNFRVRQAALHNLIVKDLDGNPTIALAKWQESKFWKECIERGEYDDTEVKYYKEESEWLIKIREDLSDINFPDGVPEYAIANPEGIYLMVMELKKMLKKDQ